MTQQLKAVVFDWAGTMIDFGSRAPVVALCRAFAAEGVTIEEAEARADMGMAKRDHIRALLAQPRVAQAWAAQHGAAPAEADGDRIFAAIEPMMRDAARDCADLIPGAAEVALPPPAAVVVAASPAAAAAAAAAEAAAASHRSSPSARP